MDIGQWTWTPAITGISTTAMVPATPSARKPATAGKTFNAPTRHWTNSKLMSKKWVSLHLLCLQWDFVGIICMCGYPYKKENQQGNSE
jgi:hypothetical protein